jgi:hypothetical protein
MPLTRVPFEQNRSSEAVSDPIRSETAIAHTQALLARLFTNEAFRRDYFDAPEESGRSFGLDAAEAASMAQIDTAAVERFAACLASKRAQDAKKTLPLTAQALGARFDAELRAAITGQPLQRRHRADAAALARRLCRMATEGRADPPWIGDLARFEMGFVEAATAGDRLTLRFFRYPVGEIARALMLGETARIRARPSFCLWLRLFGSRLFHWVV